MFTLDVSEKCPGTSFMVAGCGINERTDCARLDKVNRLAVR